MGTMSDAFLFYDVSTEVVFRGHAFLFYDVSTEVVFRGRPYVSAIRQF